MITEKFIVFLSIGTIAMMIPLILYGIWNKVNYFKSISVAILLTLVGTAGTYLMGLLENQFRFGSRSFYGAVFLIPLVFIVIAKIIKIPYGTLMDMSAPSVCIMLVLMKVLCYIEGCCGGRMVIIAEEKSFVFPSQMIELLAALILFFVLLKMTRDTKYNGKIYPYFLVLYGASRFVLNFCRAEWQEWTGTIPMGTVWSVVAIAMGMLIFFVMRGKNIE